MRINTVIEGYKLLRALADWAWLLSRRPAKKAGN